MRLHGMVMTVVALLAASLALSQSQSETTPELWTPELPDPLVGPYIVDPEILTALDRAGQGSCDGAGPLRFQCLVYRDERAKMTPGDLQSNPFEIPALKVVQATINGDLKSIRGHEEFGGAKAQGLQPGFLSYADARIELVGVVNRMDRQFNRDIVPGHGRRLACGEISAIYRFGYAGNMPRAPEGDRRYDSRLPVTMNVVFPAVPWSGKVTCKEVARRWLDYAEAVRAHGTEDLRAKADLVVSTLRPQDIDRIELNMQGSRVTASDDAEVTDFGSLATYIIRVFRWVPDENGGSWRPSYLSNQIDRARFLGLDGDENTCKENVGKKLDRKKLADWLLSMDARGANGNVIADVDNGLVNIPQPWLACRAISVSPGGASRSANQPFWKAATPAEEILSDADVEAALERYKKRFPDTLNFVGNADEFRSRLNEASCSGCHQTRAIAGFHLPGADRAGASPVNAVYLPGSAHFFGDQLRRTQILQALKASREPSRKELAASYASRPQNRFTALAPSPQPSVPRQRNLQYVGGWGGACLVKDEPNAVRRWGCAGGLECRAVFASQNQLNVGMCVNAQGKTQIGEAMQFGEVTTSNFGMDVYKRKPPLKDGKPRDTTIDTSQMTAPPGNSYFAAHQEYYEGVGGLNRKPGESDEAHARRVRDQGTGGFPGGALRLSECLGLKDEATCALMASGGFNKCLSQVGEGLRTPQSCFAIYTSYSGVRACDPANPCRDDYICMSPAQLTAENAVKKRDARLAARNAAMTSSLETEDNKKQLAIRFFGEKSPDKDFLDRNGGQGDRRGVCIPPYFVFQFKADGHVVPGR